DGRLDVACQGQRLHRALVGQGRSWVIHRDVAAPAVHRRIDALQPAGGQEGVATAGAEADYTDLAVGVGAGAQEVHGAFDVAHDGVVRRAAFGTGRHGQ